MERGPQLTEPEAAESLPLGFSGDSCEGRPPLTEQVNGQYGLMWVPKPPVPGATTGQWRSGFLLPQHRSCHPHIPSVSQECEGRMTGHFPHRSLGPRACPEATVGPGPHSDSTRHKVPDPDTLLEDTTGTGGLWEEIKCEGPRFCPKFRVAPSVTRWGLLPSPTI